MALKLQVREDFWNTSSMPLEVDGIRIHELAGLSIDEIKRAQIWQGKIKLELGEAFRISGSLSDRHIDWEGDLTRVNWIGFQHSVGSMSIRGDAGRHLGSQMSDGEIHVAGSVSDFAGVEMTGGLIRISGNGGNRIGARYPGSVHGMNRGSIFVDGNVGHGLGENMRRGTIVVGRNAGELVGWNMLAGTICVAGEVGRFAGAGMVRGSIVCGSTKQAELVPTFTAGPHVEAVGWMRVFVRWLKSQNVGCADQLLNARYQLYSGDSLYGGRGEFWQALQAS